MFRPVVCVIIAAGFSVSLAAQQPDIPPQAQTPADNAGIPTTLMRPMERANYINIFGFANGITDSVDAGPAFTGANTGTAFEGGGGITANHDFRTGTFSLGYTGDYRTQANPQFPKGTQQTVNVLFRKLLTRRWTLSVQENAGIYPLGNPFLQPGVTTQSGGIQTTSFATQTKFSGSTVSVAYQKSRRLSYEFTGTLTVLRYNSPFSYGNQSIGGSGSVLYRLNRSTTVSGTYQYSSFLYENNAGTASSNTGYLSLSQTLARHWTLGISGGATHTNASGTAEVPVGVQIGSVVIPVLVLQHYSQATNLPYAQGSVSYNLRRTVWSVSGGESVVPGNGFFLASRSIGVSGVFSYNWRRSNISAGGFYSRLTSIAYASSNKVNTADFQISYATNLTRYLGTNVRYEHVDYGNIGIYSARSDNRVTFGLYLSSKSIPLAIF
ncbi:MAG TPA: hypothetical protein VH351_21575 [Bryobacteraceae bacterium]|nr:hypothetical protein [Bryobacteraceae bacterium]